MRIRIVAVGSVTKEKTFYVLPITYESDGKTQDKKIFSFSTKAYTVLKDAKENQIYEVKLMKDKNGYWQWDDVVLSAQTGNSAAAAGSTTTNSRGFETPEERARRQVLIVRQSCLAQAIALKGVGEENVESVTDVAERFENWVMRD